jgi:hypothetical protein
MTKYSVTLSVENTGSLSPNGKVKQCYLGVATVPKAKGGNTTGALLFSPNVKNGDTVTTFKEVAEVKKLEDAAETSKIELDLDDANGLAFTFSVYDGWQLIDNVIQAFAEFTVGKVFEVGAGAIPDGFWSQPIKDQLKQWEKKLLDSLSKLSSYVQVVSVDTYSVTGLKDGTETYGLFSDVKNVNDNFGIHEDVAIRKGDLVARVKLKKVA